MQRTTALRWLVPLIAVLALISAGAGLFAPGGAGPYPFTNSYGQSVPMYGQGLYQRDSLMAGAGFRGTDLVTLLLGIPLLLLAYRAARRGSHNGQVVLCGVLLFFLYNAASMTFSAAFNPLFLVYTALFSAALFAAIIALAGLDGQALAARVQPGFPWRGTAVFLLFAGLATLLLWISEVIGPILSGTAPANLGPYTTMYTHGFDSAVISPAAVIAGLLLLRRQPLGLVLAAPILILCALVGVVVLAQTASQALAGLIFPPGVYIGMVGSWVVMGAFAIGLLRAYFRSLTRA